MPSTHPRSPTDEPHRWAETFRTCVQPTAALQFKLSTSTGLGPSHSSGSMDYPLFVVPRYLMSIVVLNVLTFVSGAILVMAGLFLENNRHFIYDLYSRAFPLSLVSFVLCALTLFVLCMDLTYFRGFFVVNSGQIICFCFAICLICSLELSAFLSATIFRQFVFDLGVQALKREIQIYPPERLNATAIPKATEVPMWIDNLQSWLSCCGADSWTDWQYRFFNNSPLALKQSLTGPGSFVLPASCCYNAESISCIRTVSISRSLPSSIFNEACVPLVKAILDRDAFIFGLVCISLFLLQVFGLLLMCVLNKRSSYRSIQAM